MNANTTAASLAALLLLGGCAAGPDYQPPSIDAGTGWSVATSAQSDAVPLENWWQNFADPQLDDLVERARAHNTDVRVAYARIAEARALRAVTGSRNAPVADLGASVTRRRQSENGPLPINRIPDLDIIQTIFDAGFDAVWELDLFGANRYRNEAADARIQQAAAQAADLQFTVSAEVARAYFELRGTQRELAALEQVVGATERTAQLVAIAATAGEFSAIDVARANAAVAASRAQLPGRQIRLRDAALAIAVLVGQLPESQLALLDSAPPQPASLSPLPVGKRADVLQRRADVRAAERALAAAAADVGVASAMRFPSLAIAGSGGFQALDAGELVNSASQRWSIAPVVSWRLLDGGRVKAEIAVSEARVEQAALVYERAVLGALADAEKALTRYHHRLTALEQQQLALTATAQSREFAELRYQAGEGPLLDLLTAQRQWAEASARHAGAQTQATVALVALYKALGGGWHEEQPQTAQN